MDKLHASFAFARCNHFTIRMPANSTFMLRRRWAFAPLRGAVLQLACHARFECVMIKQTMNDVFCNPNSTEI
jgi:hypothetical protein